jgi:uncharacterized protein YndB with AHSA1/START domain
MVARMSALLPTRRQLIGKSLALGAILAAGRTETAIADTKVEREQQPMADIMHLIKIGTSSERVYQAITTADGLRNWWTRDAEIEPKVGAAGEVGFYGKRFIAKLKVEELKPNVLVKWSVTNQAWEGKDIEFALRPNDGNTALAFVHRGFEPASDKYASATTRWGFYLFSLKRYLETGTGSPNPDDGNF